ncbi:hypothetical protein [Motilimonas pumila]|uniref:Uncharacterized protein n=1 Tax=Motilimonas pumila TaxID=2303987 RepID=A0A418YH18_9GAMM|nr:hypothetical protein [Motilimonas pumila]RJG49392.1 hypothetical protein D1Z90_05375 [Motilimonas pumila]
MNKFKALTASLSLLCCAALPLQAMANEQASTSEAKTTAANASQPWKGHFFPDLSGQPNAEQLKKMMPTIIFTEQEVIVMANEKEAARGIISVEQDKALITIGGATKHGQFSDNFGRFKFDDSESEYVRIK